LGHPGSGGVLFLNILEGGEDRKKLCASNLTGYSGWIQVSSQEHDRHGSASLGNITEQECFHG